MKQEPTWADVRESMRALEFAFAKLRQQVTGEKENPFADIFKNFYPRTK